MFSIIAREPVKRSLSRWLSSYVVATKEKDKNVPKDKAIPKQNVTTPKVEKDKLDALQLEAMTKECCFLVDMDDKVIGTASKEVCHLIKPDGSIPLHRAFSVFLFTSKEQLILQKRASKKITYPDHYTNSCCSHPIVDQPGEDEEKDALGVKRAAQRRLNFELGIPIESIPLDKFTYLTRIHYMDLGNGKWGEHEIDYVLFVQGDFTIKPNSNEVSEISYVPKEQIDAFLPTLNAPLTPWFALILQYRLKLWWNNLKDLKPFQDHKSVLSLGQCLNK